MRRDRRIWLVVLALSLFVHAGALAVLAPSEQVRGERTEGGSVNLADNLPSALMVQGMDVQSDPDSDTLEAVEPVEASEAPVETAQMSEPQDAEAAEAPELQEPVAAEPVRNVEAEEPQQVRLQTATPVEAVDAAPVEIAKVATGEGVQAAASETADAVMPVTAEPATQDEAAAKPVETGEVDAVAPTQTVAAIATVPMPRRNPVIDRSEPRRKPQAERRTSSAKRGNAEHDRSRSANARASAPSRKAGNAGRRQTSAGHFNSANYAGRVMAHLRRHQRYPGAARRARLQGKAMVRFTIRSNGTVSGVSLVRSSGHSMLDREALAMVRRASRFPPIPRGAGRNSMSFTAPVNYRLR